MQVHHVVVWLDHAEAHIIAFNCDVAASPVIVHSPHRHQKHLSDTRGPDNAVEQPEYYEDIISRISNIPQWLIVGPANAKLGFSKHLKKRHANLVNHVVGLETVDHPSDGQLLAYAKKYFVAPDRMNGSPTSS